MNSTWLFNLGADIYAWFTAQSAWRDSCARLAEAVAPLEPARVLDLGCGPGVSTFELARRLPGANVVGLDVAPRMLQEARRRARAIRSNHVHWLRGDAAHLPLADGCLDAVTGHSFLYLVQNREGVLREITRVLRPGGRVVLMEPNARASSLAAVLALSHDPRHLVSVALWRPFSRLHGRFTPASLEHTLKQAGFVHCQVQETLNGLGLVALAARE